MMALRLQLNVKRLFPFILFRFLAQMTFWLAVVAAGAAVASLITRSRGEFWAATAGAAIGSLFSWISILPYELRIEPVEMRPCLINITAYLVRSNAALATVANPAQPGVGEWVANQRWKRWKGNEVDVLIEGNAVIVRGPRSMIKPLWRNFRGPWRKVLMPA